VIVLVGDFDLAFCDAPSCSASGSFASEPGFYAPDACAEAVVIPRSGHILNLHFIAPLTYLTLLDWMDWRVGRDPGRRAPEPCP
jgi:hypothetical protein